MSEREKAVLGEWWGGWAGAQRVMAFVGCVVLLPLFAVLYVLVRGTSRGPFLFRQIRRGYRGRPFVIYKIRTMKEGGGKSTVQSVVGNHPDTTRIGRVLRELKVDELVQLWNVAKGEMALVGPRPIPTDLEDFLLERIPDFGKRRRVLPGLTSLGQLAARSETRSVESILEDWRKRHELDLEGIEKQSFRYDLYVLVKTVGYMVGRAMRSLRFASVCESGVGGVGGVHRGTLVLGTAIANASYEQVIGQIKEWRECGSSHYIGVVSVHSVVTARWREGHRRALEEASLNTADGVPIVWAQKLLGYGKATRVAGCSLMPMVLERAEAEGWRVAFYGGSPERLRELVVRMRRRYPGLAITDAISPPFRELSVEEDREVVDRLNAGRPDIVFVGLGCPKQERWMLEHRGRVRGILIGVGAAFDLHAGVVPPTPPVLQRAGLEWLFRLCCEPRRLFWRYATTNPAYVVMILWQLIKRWVLRRDYQVELKWGEMAGGRIEVQSFGNIERVGVGRATEEVEARREVVGAGVMEG